MFWRFGGYANISTIDTILEKPDVTLEELLDESDLIQELKQHNTKLIEFLRDESVIKRLLEYVTAPKATAPLPIEPATATTTIVELKTEDEVSTDEDEPDEEKKAKKAKELEEKKDDEDTPPEVPPKEQTDLEREQVEKVRAKYSYVACEVLSSEAWSICEALMDNLDNLQAFWKFLERPAPLDPLQAGYFTKVNETLLDKKTEEMMDFFKSINNIIPMMLKHVDCPMIMDLLLKIISMEKSEGGQGIVDWLQSRELIPRLLAFLSPANSSTTQTSTGDFLKAIITISANASQNEQSCIGPNNLTRQLVSEACIQSLINEMLKGGNPLTVGVGIIIEVIRKNNSDYDPEVSGGIDTVPSGRDPIYLGTLLRLFAKHVPEFMKLITSQEVSITHADGSVTSKKRELKAAFGGTIEPLGFDRFKTCELMAELLHCSNMGLLNDKGSEDYVKQRDEERNRLKAERDKDLAHMAQVGSTSAENVENSSIQVRHENSEAMPEKKDDDDGFEDVTVTGVLAEHTDGEFRDEAGKVVAPNDTPATEASTTESEVDTAPAALEVPTTSEPVEATSPTAEIASELKDTTLDEDTVMRSPSPPLAELDTTIGEKIEPLQSEEKPDERMTTPTPTDQSDMDLTEESTSKDVDTNKELPALPIDTTPEILVGGENLKLGLDNELLNVEGLEMDFNGRPLVGDYLKMMFVQNSVVPTILDFFFRFPWNNFLHNVVYDVVQQVFNGPMERGFNRHLAIDLFVKGQITNRIVEGQKRSDKAQDESNMRLGYMGHLTLIAEEVVKFTERHPPEMLSTVVMDKVLDNDWIYYVEQTLAETRERDNAILGGVRPDIMPGGRGGSGLAPTPVFGGSLASQSNIAETGLDTVELQNAELGEGNDASRNDAFGGTIDENDNDVDGIEDVAGTTEVQREGGLSSGFGSSSDEDEDEEMGMDTIEDDEELERISAQGKSDQVSHLQNLLSKNPEDDEDNEKRVGQGEDEEKPEPPAMERTTGELGVDVSTVDTETTEHQEKTTTADTDPAEPKQEEIPVQEEEQQQQSVTAEEKD